jgi:hypothetical protein
MNALETIIERQIATAVDLITASIDGRSSEEPEITQANEILCRTLEIINKNKAKP